MGRFGLGQLSADGFQVLAEDIAKSKVLLMAEVLVAFSSSQPDFFSTGSRPSRFMRRVSSAQTSSRAFSFWFRERDELGAPLGELAVSGRRKWHREQTAAEPLAVAGPLRSSCRY